MLLVVYSVLYEDRTKEFIPGVEFPLPYIFNLSLHGLVPSPGKNSLLQFQNFFLVLPWDIFAIVFSWTIARLLLEHIYTDRVPQVLALNWFPFVIFTHVYNAFILLKYTLYHTKFQRQLHKTNVSALCFGSLSKQPCFLLAFDEILLSSSYPSLI